MEYPKLYRNRLIPKESILLEDDNIIYMDNSVIITSWNTLKPKKSLSHGYSCYFLEEGYKVSKFLDHHNNLLYWYCDIIDTKYIMENNTFIFTDLLIDVLVFEDGSSQIVDVDEVVDALNDNLIDTTLLKSALTSLDKLLKIVYSGEFKKLQHIIDTNITSSFDR